MKLKTIFLAIVALYATFSYQGCGDAIPLPPDPDKIFAPPVVRDPMTWQVDNGVLVFLDDDHLDQGQQYLDGLSMEERIHFEDSLGFRSLRTIEHMVNESENEAIDDFFSGVDSTLSNAAYQAMGFPHSTLYQTYEQAGVVMTVWEPDTSWYVAMTCRASGMYGVLNADGAVIVGDRKYVYEDSVRKTYTLTGELLETEASQKQAGVLTNFDKTWHLGGGIAGSGSTFWMMDPCKSNGRYTVKIIYSCTFNSSVVRPRLRYLVMAHCKRYGSWGYRPGYTPFWGVEGTWDYRYYVTYSGQKYELKGSVNPMANNYPKSPHVLSGLNSNYVDRYLSPTGDYSAYAGITFHDNVKITGLHFIFKFSGCANGFGYTIQ